MQEILWQSEKNIWSEKNDCLYHPRNLHDFKKKGSSAKLNPAKYYNFADNEFNPNKVEDLSEKTLK